MIGLAFVAVTRREAEAVNIFYESKARGGRWSNCTVSIMAMPMKC